MKKKITELEVDLSANNSEDDEGSGQEDNAHGGGKSKHNSPLFFSRKSRAY